MFDHSFNLLELGDSGVGKTSLLLRFTEDTFVTDAGVTMGIDFKTRTLLINDQFIRLAIWDTAGQERFRTIPHAVYRPAHGVILVYDVTRRETFEHLEQWLDEIKKKFGNKNENLFIKEVQTSDAKEFAKRLKIPFIETSSMHGMNVDEMFRMIAMEVLLHDLQQKDKINREAGETVKPTETMKKTTNRC